MHAAVTLHGLNKLGLAKEGTAAVFGCGAIGLLAVSQMKLLGAGKVIAVWKDLGTLFSIRVVCFMRAL